MLTGNHNLLTQAPFLTQALALAHESWHPILADALAAVETSLPGYLSSLIEGEFLPTRKRLFAAFSLPLSEVKYVLVGEGPYPREESATGVCFMDGAVRELWSQEIAGGLSKKVNRATSLRNFIKMLLVADGRLQPTNTSGSALSEISTFARSPNSALIQSLPDLQKNLIQQGFLLLNASLVFRKEVAPAKDAKAWQPFLEVVFSALKEQQYVANCPPVSLVLWGKIAEQLRQIPTVNQMPQLCAEHPYNLSFIVNPTMLNFFAPLHLLATVKE